MRRLIESTYVTLDGVISSPAQWSRPYQDEQYHQYAGDLLGDTDALLLGRQAYEEIASPATDLTALDKGYASRLDGLPKHVVSRTLKHATWNGTLIAGDIAAEVAGLKKRPGQDILKLGTGEIDRVLLADKLVDEYFLWVFPVIAGRGSRLLDGADTAHLTLRGTTRLNSGVVLLTYAPT
ncbi:dihydrofolate reductase family protein [Streptodolium elevatio]|uniref:Dihydrofolate reductase family protein n=1 Tax=Streptodolium elevatio TaxID=3157996 RepID=A0ABV3DT21_9ACTN